MPQYLYTSDLFNVDSIESARKIILTAEGNSTEEIWETEERWEKETPTVVEWIIEASRPHENSLVLDYGCGIGRIAKELIAQTGCKVIGVDISPNMRAFAIQYVNDERFAAVSPVSLPYLYKSGLQFHSAYAVWVLQHVAKPDIDIRNIYMSLRPEAPFCVLNNKARAIPVTHEEQLFWAEDGIDIQEVTKQYFTPVDDPRQLPEGVCPASVRDHTYWQVYTT